ncbi:MAG: DUF2460 domain-containing protein [Proteobacteria bacterium]|nr:DUF2460 domain-containing protein [Pseudomonadota bacterium]
MAFWLCPKREGQDSDWIQRFDPRFWTVNFPRPMMAALTVPAPDTLRVDAAFLRQGDLAGVIWDSVDSLDHPLLAYVTDRDYSRTTLSFRWRSGGVIALDAANGPTLTIEGRDAAGTARTWYIRLWNYARGSPDDAQITLPFSQLKDGWLVAADAQPIHPAAIDRMFISLVPQGYVGESTAPLASPADGWAELSAIRCEGRGAMLEIGDVVVPPHGLCVATGYDDAAGQTPDRLVRNALQLGYRGSLLHYAGMSHFMRLTAQPGGAFAVSSSGDPLCAPARTWHRAFFSAALAAGFSPILSLSYELLAQHCPAAWQQRAFDGTPARTGWAPPSALLSPANAAAMAWLQFAAAAFAGLMKECGAPVRFQIGEPWWWVMADGRPCLYDDAAKTALGGNPVQIGTVGGALGQAETALLDAAGAVLAGSTAALRDAVRAAAAPQAAEILLLAFLPDLLDPARPDLRRANLPVGWAAPAYDRLQVEDYDWLTGGAEARRKAAYAAINDRLGYPPGDQDYLAGFVLRADQAGQWRAIDVGIDEAAARGVHDRFVWALPQICRDGFTRLPAPSDEDDMLPFDDVPYPLALGRDASVTPEFSTSVAVTASGFERRNSLWSDARLRFDVGPGVRSERELGVLLGFFRARRGAARGFRLRDPSDWSSNGMTDPPGGADQLLGTGDGLRASFPLVKRYGEGDAEQLRRITRPHGNSVMVSIDGAAIGSGWTLDPGGVIRFAAAPTLGAVVRAGFVFDVPVRFAEDKLDISGTVFAAGEAPSVPVIEIREAAA